MLRCLITSENYSMLFWCEIINNTHNDVIDTFVRVNTCRSSSNASDWMTPGHWLFTIMKNQQFPLFFESYLAWISAWLNKFIKVPHISVYSKLMKLALKVFYIKQEYNTRIKHYWNAKSLFLKKALDEYTIWPYFRIQSILKLSFVANDFTLDFREWSLKHNCHITLFLLWWKTDGYRYSHLKIIEKIHRS